MGESRVSLGRGCLSANGEGSRESMCTAESCGEGIAIVRGNVGSGSAGCGDDGGVLRLRWLARTSSIISTAVSSAAEIIGERVGVVIVRVDEGEMLILRQSKESFISLWALHRP